MARAPLAALFVVTVAGCLSGGPPPVGQPLIQGRGVYRVSFLGDKPGAPLLVYAHSINRQTPATDLHLITAAPGGQSFTDSLLVENVLLKDISRVDSRGRLLLATGHPSGDPATGVRDLRLVDPVTGEQLRLGSGTFQGQSDSGDRFTYATNDGRTWLHEVADDRETLLGTRREERAAQFLGEDVYYSLLSPMDTGAGMPPGMGVNFDFDLWRLAAGGAPERIVSNLTSFSILDRFVVLTRGDATGALSTFDPGTRDEKVIPADTIISVAPDRRWILAGKNPAYDPSTGASPTGTAAAVFFELATGSSETIELPLPHVPFPWWRPGHGDEVWFSTETTTIVKRGAAPVQVDRVSNAALTRGNGTNTIFTSDGAYFSTSQSGQSSYEERAPNFLVPADDPTSAGLELNPAGTGISFMYEVSGSRLLIGVLYQRVDRADLMLFDIATGKSRLLGEAGSVVAIGERRILVTLHRIGLVGDLAVIDLDTGATTKLAESVVTAVVDRQPPGTDPLAPGTRVAYILQNSIASPYDGAWIVTLP